MGVADYKSCSMRSQAGAWEREKDEIDFKNKIKQLLQKYPSIDKNAMGFIKNWEKLDIMERLKR